MRLLSFIFLCILCSLSHQKVVLANDVLLASMQESIESLRQSIEALKITVDSQNEVIKEQAIRINALENRGANSSPQGLRTAGENAQSVGLPARGISQGINPEIGAVGTVQAHLTEDSADEEGKDTIALKEFELSLAQYVDPFSRLDAIIAFNDNLEEQNVDIEEAYYSHWGLPFGFTGQIGKFRSKIGKQNLQHLHALDTVDYALVIRDFFGDEGLSSSGVRIQNNIPNPFDIPLEITGEVLRGNNGNSFSGVSRRPIFNLHAKTQLEFSKQSNLELGWTTLFGDENSNGTAMDGDGVESEINRENGQDRYGVKVYGADLTFNHLMDEGRVLKFQNEAYFQNRPGATRHANRDPWGFYSLLDFRFSKRFSTGLRFDLLEPLDVVGDHVRTAAVSPYLTFWQSEFASFRLQFSHTDPADGNAKSDDAVYLQANFMIGAHKHPVQ